MFLHLSQDEKFIDAARAAFELAAPGEHAFVVVDAIGPLRHINSFQPQRMTLAQVLDPAFLATLPSYDATFLHSLNKPNRLVVDRAPAMTRFVWLGWGYDYYGLIRAPGELLLPQTRALMASLRSNSRAGTLVALAKEALRSPARIPAALRLRRIGPGGRDELSLLQKIKFFSPVLPIEYPLVRNRHPSFRPRYAAWNYAVHDIVDGVPPSIDHHAHRVVVGNSATPECNHLEAFDAIADFDGEVLVPLSYGNPTYRDAILREGRERLGERFRPLTDYMAADAYARLIANSSHLVMNHLRQQGLTNVLIALQAGTRVVMRRENPLFSYLVGLGLQIDDIAYGLARPPLTNDIVLSNRARVSAQFGAAHHAARTRLFLDEVAHDGERTCIA